MITVLANRMLYYAGVASSVVMIHDARDGPFDDTFISYGQVDVPALALETWHKWIWVFPSLRHQPIGLIPPYVQGQMGVLLDGARQGELLETGTHAPTVTQTVFRRRLRVHPDGRLDVRLRLEYHGSKALKYRPGLARLAPKVLARVAQRYVSRQKHVTRVHRAHFLHIGEPPKPLVLVSDHRMRGLVTLGDDEAVLRLFGGFMHPPPVTRRRVRPITTKESFRLVAVWEVRVPANWRLAKAPKSYVFSNEFGRARLDVKQSGSAVTVRQIITYKKLRRPAEQYRVLQRLEAGIRRIQQPKLVFRILRSVPMNAPKPGRPTTP